MGQLNLIVRVDRLDSPHVLAVNAELEHPLLLEEGPEETRAVSGRATAEFIANVTESALDSIHKLAYKLTRVVRPPVVVELVEDKRRLHIEVSKPDDAARLMAEAKAFFRLSDR